jgi:hypothetical protein
MALRHEDSDKAITRLRVLQMGNDPADVEMVLRNLRNDRSEVSSDVVQTAVEFTARVQADNDVIVADYHSQWKGMDCRKSSFEAGAASRKKRWPRKIAELPRSNANWDSLPTSPRLT